MFRDFDRNQDRAIDFAEFKSGVVVAQEAGLMSSSLKPLEWWYRFDTNPAGQVDIYGFIHFCVAVTSDADDNGASAREECWDVFTHFDEDKSQDLSQREFLKGMRRAIRQGHVASSNPTSIWTRLPKNKFSRLDVGPFVDFCLSISKGDDPLVAARDAVPIPMPNVRSPIDGFEAGLARTTGLEETTGLARTAVTVGSNSDGKFFCRMAHKQADADGDGLVSLSEFKSKCTLLFNETECKNATGLFSQFGTTSQNMLNVAEFMNACQSGSVALHAGKAELAQRIASSKEAGAAAFAGKGDDAFLERSSVSAVAPSTVETVILRHRERRKQPKSIR